MIFRIGFIIFEDLKEMVIKIYLLKFSCYQKEKKNPILKIKKNRVYK